MTAEQINPNAKRTMVFMGLLATFGSLLFGYDTGVINGALPYMARPDQLNLTPALEGLVGSAICIGAAIGSFLSGRRTMLTIGLCGVLTANILIGVISSTLEGSPLLPYFILTLTVIFLGFQQSCVSPATWLMISEIFPTRMRSTCMGLTILCLWCTNFIVTLVFPILLGTVGISNTFFIFGALCICSLIFVRTSMPETKHLSIEEIERKFRNETK